MVANSGSSSRKSIPQLISTIASFLPSPPKDRNNSKNQTTPNPPSKSSISNFKRAFTSLTNHLVNDPSERNAVNFLSFATDLQSHIPLLNAAASHDLNFVIFESLCQLIYNLAFKSSPGKLNLPFWQVFWGPCVTLLFGLINDIFHFNSTKSDRAYTVIKTALIPLIGQPDLPDSIQHQACLLVADVLASPTIGVIAKRDLSKDYRITLIMALDNATDYLVQDVLCEIIYRIQPGNLNQRRAVLKDLILSHSGWVDLFSNLHNDDLDHAIPSQLLIINRGKSATSAHKSDYPLLMRVLHIGVKDDLDGSNRYFLDDSNHPCYLGMGRERLTSVGSWSMRTTSSDSEMSTMNEICALRVSYRNIKHVLITNNDLPRSGHGLVISAEDNYSLIHPRVVAAHQTIRLIFKTMGECTQIKTVLKRHCPTAEFVDDSIPLKASSTFVSVRMNKESPVTNENGQNNAMDSLKSVPTAPSSPIHSNMDTLGEEPHPSTSLQQLTHLPESPPKELPHHIPVHEEPYVSSTSVEDTFGTVPSRLHYDSVLNIHVRKSRALSRLKRRNNLGTAVSATAKNGGDSRVMSGPLVPDYPEAQSPLSEKEPVGRTRRLLGNTSDKPYSSDMDLIPKHVPDPFVMHSPTPDREDPPQSKHSVMKSGLQESIKVRPTLPKKSVLSKGSKRYRKYESSDTSDSLHPATSSPIGNMEPASSISPKVAKRHVTPDRSPLLRRITLDVPEFRSLKDVASGDCAAAKENMTGNTSSGSLHIDPGHARSQLGVETMPSVLHEPDAATIPDALPTPTRSKFSAPSVRPILTKSLTDNIRPAQQEQQQSVENVETITSRIMKQIHLEFTSLKADMVRKEFPVQQQPPHMNTSYPTTPARYANLISREGEPTVPKTPFGRRENVEPKQSTTRTPGFQFRTPTAQVTTTLRYEPSRYTHHSMVGALGGGGYPTPLSASRFRQQGTNPTRTNARYAPHIVTAALPETPRTSSVIETIRTRAADTLLLSPRKELVDSFNGIAQALSDEIEFGVDAGLQLVENMVEPLQEMADAWVHDSHVEALCAVENAEREVGRYQRGSEAAAFDMAVRELLNEVDSE